MDSHVLVGNPPIDINLLLRQQQLTKQSEVEVPSGIVFASMDNQKTNSAMPPLVSTGGKKCRLFIRQVTSEGSGGRCQIEVLPLHSENGEQLSEEQSSRDLSSGSSNVASSGVSSDFGGNLSSFTERDSSVPQRNDTDISDAFTDLPIDLSSFSANDSVLLLAASTSETPSLQVSLSVDRLDFERGLKGRKKIFDAKYIIKKPTEDTADCSDTDEQTRETDVSDAFTDLSMHLDKSGTTPSTIVLDSVTSNLDQALEVKLIESILETAESTTAQNEEISFQHPR